MQARPSPPPVPFSVFNCARYGTARSSACNESLLRLDYNRVYAIYLFNAAQAVWEQSARPKLSHRHPEVVERRFELGDLTQRYDSVRWSISTVIRRDDNGIVPERTVAGQVETVSLGVWTEQHDLGAKLFVKGWLTMWNSRLVEPFPEQCALVYDAQKRAWKQRELGCVDLDWMMRLAVANAKYHLAFQRTGYMEDVPGLFYINSRQRWGWVA